MSRAKMPKMRSRNLISTNIRQNVAHEFNSTTDRSMHIHMGAGNMIRTGARAKYQSSCDGTSSAGPLMSRIQTVRSLIDSQEMNGMINMDNDKTEMFEDPKMMKTIIDAKKYFKKANIQLVYMRSGSTGHAFKAVSTIDGKPMYAVKVCAYPHDKHGNMNDEARPENAELKMLYLLSYFTLNIKTPHFVLPIITFNTTIDMFVNMPNDIIKFDGSKPNYDSYNNFLDKYDNGGYNDIVSVLICEWCDNGDLMSYIRAKHKEMTKRDWVVIFFQILYTLAMTHEKYPDFRHNDLKPNNILVKSTDPSLDKNQRYKYSLGKYDFSIPNIGIQVKIWDFDFACIDGIVNNNKVDADWTTSLNVSSKKHQYYDMHYFFNTLTSRRFFSDFYTGGAPEEIVEFVSRVVPEKYKCGTSVTKKGRFLKQCEFLTPLSVLTTDPLFKKYRFINNANSRKQN